MTLLQATFSEASATSNASHCLRYWETQLGKTTQNSNGTVVAKKTVSSAFNSSRSEDFPCTIESSCSGVPNRGYSLPFCHYDCTSSVSLLQQRFPLSQRVLSFLSIVCCTINSFIIIIPGTIPQLVNFFISVGKVPYEWKLAIIKQWFKKGVFI